MGEVKLTRRHWNVLRALAGESGLRKLTSLPNGHGHCSRGLYASLETVAELRQEGLVEWGRNENHWRGNGGYRLTDDGRTLVEAESTNA